MRCLFCDTEVVTHDNSLGIPITLPGRGVAHTDCAVKDLVTRRIFGPISLRELEDNDLYELRELVLTEINEREGHSHEGAELF